MKIRQTRNQLIFSPLGIMEQLIFRWEQHFKEYRRYPTKIFLNEEQWNDYKNNFPLNMPSFGDKLYFRGAEVIIKK